MYVVPALIVGCSWARNLADGKQRDGLQHSPLSKIDIQPIIKAHLDMYFPIDIKIGSYAPYGGEEEQGIGAGRVGKDEKLGNRNGSSDGSDDLKEATRVDGVQTLDFDESKQGLFGVLGEGQGEDDANVKIEAEA